MTLKQLTEEVQQQFPKFGFTQIRLWANKINSDFARKTRLLTDTIDITEFSPSVWDEVEVSWGDAEVEVSWGDAVLAYSYDLDSSIDRIKKVEFFDVNNKLVAEDSIKWDIIDSNLILYFMADSNYTIDSVPFTTIRLSYIKKPSLLVLVSDELPYDEQYNEVLLNGILYKAAIASRDFQTANYYKQEYREGIVDGMKSSNTGMDNTEIVPVTIFNQ